MRCFEIPNRGNPKLIYKTTKVHYKTNLTEEIQRDKSKDSSARGTTYILLGQSGKEENVSMYNGRGLGWKGTGVGRKSLVGFKGLQRSLKVFEDLRRALKTYWRLQRDFKGHLGTLKRF